MLLLFEFLHIFQQTTLYCQLQNPYQNIGIILGNLFIQAPLYQIFFLMKIFLRVLLLLMGLKLFFLKKIFHQNIILNIQIFRIFKMWKFLQGFVRRVLVLHQKIIREQDFCHIVLIFLFCDDREGGQFFIIFMNILFQRQKKNIEKYFI